MPYEMPQPRINRSSFKRFQAEEAPEPVAQEGPRIGRNIVPSYANRIAEEKYAAERSDKAQKAREQEMVDRVVFGNVGDSGEGDYMRKLNVELQNPALPMTEGESKFRSDPYAAERMKKEATTLVKPKGGTEDITDQLIRYAQTWNPGDLMDSGRKDAEGNPIMKPVSVGEIQRAAMRRSGTKMNFDPNHPGWAELEKRFAQAPAPKEEKGLGFMGLMQKISRKAYKNSLGLLDEKKPAVASAPTESASPEMPDFSPPPALAEDNPYADEYPDAFQEDGQWKVVVDGKKFILAGE